MKSKLSEVRDWLLIQELSIDREVCLALAYELDKLRLSDLPQTDLGDEYRAYCQALAEGLDSDDPERRVFYLVSSTHFGYVEELLSRIGLISIRQIVTHRFIATLAKGVALVGLSVAVLIAAMLWYDEGTKPSYVMVASFVAVGAALLLLEVWVDLRRYYDDDLDFIEQPAEAPRCTRSATAGFARFRTRVNSNVGHQRKS